MVADKGIDKQRNYAIIEEYDSVTILVTLLTKHLAIFKGMVKIFCLMMEGIANL